MGHAVMSADEEMEDFFATHDSGNHGDNGDEQQTKRDCLRGVI